MTLSFDVLQLFIFGLATVCARVALVLLKAVIGGIAD